ncbi:MAG TPA: inositol monophosphatase family protein [Blastocatellia bacterium]|nr:inositol monophosphatase family protein [Blastocatellia bacterium]
MIDFATELAREAGSLLRARFGTGFDVRQKGAINLVTEVDLASEQLIRNAIASRYPLHQMLGEEGGLGESARPEGAESSTSSDVIEYVPDGSAEYKWIVDPLDGTTNYAHGYPCFCVSIALERRGRVELGVVYDPMRDELFRAKRGLGATLNGQTIRVSSTLHLMQSLLSTGFPYDIKTSNLTNLDHWANFAMNAQALRRDGAAALDLCYVASGRYDGFWELSLSAWDTAAGALIVEEAGGRLSNFEGGEFSPYVPEVVASNGLIHQRMLEVLAMGKRGV